MKAIQQLVTVVATFVVSLCFIANSVAREPYSAKRIHQVLKNASLQRVIFVLRRVKGRLPDHDGLSPLETACRHGRVEVVQLLLDRGDMPNDAVRALTSRRVASWYARHDKAGDRELANQCMDLYERIKPTAAPDLIAACYANDKAVFTSGHRRCVADEDLRHRVMEVCAAWNRNDFLRTLIALTGDNGDRAEWNVTIPAVAAGNREGLRMLLDAGADPNVDFFARGTGANSLVQMGALDNRPECIRLLVDRGADVNRQSDRGKTALHFAVERRNIDAVRTLLSIGADPNLARRDGVTPLDSGLIALTPTKTQVRDPEYIAVRIARILVEAKAVPTPLYAIAIRDIDLLEERMRLSPAGPNARVSHSPLLHLAARWDNLEAAEWLVNAGADLSARTPFNNSTVLHEAAGGPASEAIVEWLIRKGASVNAKNKHGSMPIHFAAGSLNDEALRVLIAHGADTKTLMKPRYNLETIVRLAARRRGDDKDAQERAKRCLEALGVKADPK